jgi:DNA-binding CsgD family transcriptional regulator/tetratricopeptide (TPR) repeat protein
MRQTAGTHLVGRAAELASLEHVLAELARGPSAAVEIVGEPGIGKTRMLVELSARADARRQRVLSGSASELESDLPFWVFVDALDEYVQGLEPQRLDSLDGDVRTELAHVFPSLSALVGGGDGVALQHERYRTHRAVRALLELLAATKPLVLVLDDLQWADSGSVELLGALLHRPPDGAVLMALAVRPGRVPDRLSAALERARRAGTLARIELATLTQGEAREFLGDAIDDATATALYEESGGNPFYLEQLARTLDRGSPATPASADISPAAVEVPPPVAAALAQELGLLSDGTRLVLEGAAVAGDPFEPELAAAAAATPEATAMAALDELLRFDLVRHTDVPRRFRFRHPLVRRAVYESTPGGWRLGAHERSAEALALRGAPAVARAHHVERSARKGDATAVAILREAGEASASRAPASAARWFAAALRLVPEDAAEERVELLLARAGSLAAIGQFSDSHAALLESIALVPDESVALRVRLTTACAGVEHLLGRHEQAHDRLAGELQGLEDPGSPEAVSLLVELATDGFYRMEYETMHEWAGRALSAARPLGDQSLIAAAAAALAYAGALTGAITEAEMHRSEAAALVDALPDDELALRLDAAVNLSAAEIDLERIVEAEAHAERALAVGRATGQSAVVPLLVLALGWVRRLRGQLAEAGELFDGAVEGARLSGNAMSLAGNLLNRSLTALAAGDVETALAAAEESVELTRPLDQSLMSASAGLALAAALLESGDPARAVAALVEPSGGEELTLIPGAWKTNWLELVTRCWLALGRLEEAKRSAARAEACAAARGFRLATGMADRAAAAVAFEAGDSDLAAKRALASAAAAEEVGVPVEAALSRTLAGRALARAGRLESATAELQRAAAQFHAHGAFRYRDQAEHELRGLGHQIHRRTRPGKADRGVASLTERELQVARLVVDRKTNPEIAAELYVSQKTVETHLRNIFRKLDVSSRVEVARAVERADRADRTLLR